MELLTPAALALAALIYGLERFGLLPKRKSAADAAGELEIAEHTIHRLRHERDSVRQENAALEATRSLEPVLAQLSSNAELQKQVLDRLVHHNGSFAHMESGMRELQESLKLLSGFIAALVDLPTRDKETTT